MTSATRGKDGRRRKGVSDRRTSDVGGGEDARSVRIRGGGAGQRDAPSRLTTTGSAMVARVTTVRAVVGRARPVGMARRSPRLPAILRAKRGRAMESARVRSGDLNPGRGAARAQWKKRTEERGPTGAPREGRSTWIYVRDVAYLRADMAIVMVGAFDACVWRERL